MSKLSGLARTIKQVPALTRITKQILVSKLTGKRIPILVSFHVTNNCTLRCRYCYANVDDRFDDQGKDFSTEEVKGLIDEMYEAGTRWLIILGGEPLMREDIGEIISYTKGKGMLCEVVTNGVLVKDRIDDILAADLLCISLDGDEEANDAVRGKGTYKRIVEGLRVASDHGLKTRIHAVLSKANANERCLAHLDELAKENGATFGYSSPIVHEYNKIDELFLPEDEERNFWRKAKECKREGNGLYNTANAMENILKWPLSPSEIITTKDGLKKLGSYKPNPCFAGHRECYIDNEGDIYACICRGVKSGMNVREVGFKKAWEGLASFECGACSYIQYAELNDVLDFRPHSVLLGLKTFFRL